MLRHGSNCLGVALVAAFLGVSAVPAAAQSPTAIDECGVITQAGSYLVTRNLPGPGGLQGDDCLIVRSNLVTIDLGGFVLRGNKNGNGITDDDKTRRSITVRNGTITKFEIGVDLSKTSEAVIRDLQVVDNDKEGIRAGKGCFIADNVASRNGGDGIFAKNGDCTVQDNVANSNDDGLQLDGNGHRVSGNTANNNDGDGIQVKCPSSLIGNVALDNDDDNLNLSGKRCLSFKNLTR